MRARLGIIGIVLFVLLDVALVYLAVRHVQATPPPADPGQIRADGPTQSAAPSSPSTGESPQQEAPNGQSSDSFESSDYLAVAEDATFIRATRGSCDQGERPVIEISTDGGQAFQTADIPNVTEVLQVNAADSDNLSVVGTNQQCSPGHYVTQNGGDTWKRSDGADSLWYMARNQSVPKVVHAPGRLRETPCDPLSLSTVDNEVLRILCTDGQIIGTADLGSSWVRLGRLQGAVTIQFTSPGEGYALAAQPTCPSAVMETVDGGARWDRIACLGEGSPRAIAASGDIIAAQVESNLHISTDQGLSWNVP